MKSDLLLKEVTQKKIEKLNEVKDYLICAATGDIEKNDSTALEHLQTLVYLTNDLNCLMDNLPFISVDFEGLSNS
ncbi:MAG: hypothetical protein K0M40_22730 [Prolixibacteraceae bacterium]|nr:hypothetical protein [Prolixibacteraceae bacterium]